MKYSGGGPFMYVYCVVCYRVIAALYVRSAVKTLHTVTLLMMIQLSILHKDLLIY